MIEKYMSLRPSSGKCNALYLRPKIAPKGNVWYDDVPVGVHQLQQIVAKMCREAGLDGLFTNHSLRATAATRTYAAGVDEQLIAGKKLVTGHLRFATTNAPPRNNYTSVSDLIQKPSSVPPEPKKVKLNESVSFGSRKEINITAGDVTVNLRLQCACI
ncbi:uncharacterized protein LOC130051590 [Ostrea edulis]|uniref:uncharacterized protein LOC130051590 n=1 Tax=Ostrea edulis TaxID=37623 RepID=UPI0024AE94D3|nr:uncharacterized protein LOC130051590 [Ostrea edulis]